MDNEHAIEEVENWIEDAVFDAGEDEFGYQTEPEFVIVDNGDSITVYLED